MSKRNKLTEEDFRNACKLLRNLPPSEPAPLVFSQVQLDVFTKEGLHVDLEKMTVSGFPFVFMKSINEFL